MKKPKTPGQRIRALRKFRGETQAQFGEYLGVKRAAVSAWEADDKLRRPSAAIYLRLALLARDAEEAAFFLSQTPIDKQIIFSLANKLFDAILPPDSLPDLLDVGPLPGTPDQGPLLISGEGLRNPGSLYYLCPADNVSWMGLPPGVVILDTRERGNRLAPFWLSLVVARDSRASDDFPAYVVGTLLKLNYSGAVSGLAPGQAMAVLSGSAYSRPFAAFDIGRYSHPKWREKGFQRRIREDQEFLEKESVRVSGLAEKDMTTYPGIEIVGRVLRWDSWEDRAHILPEAK